MNSEFLSTNFKEIITKCLNGYYGTLISPHGNNSCPAIKFVIP